ncbi:MAG TPA: helix-hairpin-helix domain-containing protein, partial [Humisphaera sp.]
RRRGTGRMHDTLTPTTPGAGEAADAATPVPAFTDPVAPAPPSAPAPAEAEPAVPAASRRSSLARRAVETLTFTAPQRRALLVVIAVVLCVLAWRLVRDRADVPDPQPPRALRADQLESRLDPNSAPWEELVALPQLGEKRARAIVEYRDERAKRRPGQPAFTQPIDLVVVKGIGLSMVENLTPHLRFPAATRPSTP